MFVFLQNKKLRVRAAKQLSQVTLTHTGVRGSPSLNPSVSVQSMWLSQCPQPPRGWTCAPEEFATWETWQLWNHNT